MGAGILGVVLAGGASRRFGKDKALALIDGRTLLDHALAALAQQVDALAVSGRTWPAVASFADAPAPGLGPAGGLAGALAHAHANGHAAVLTVPVDAWPLPPDLRSRLEPAPAVAVGSPVIGLWPVAFQPALLASIAAGERRMQALARLAGARDVAFPPHRNINFPADLPRSCVGP